VKFERIRIDDIKNGIELIKTFQTRVRKIYLRKGLQFKIFDFFCQNNYCLMNTFADLIRIAREEKGLFLRQVAASMDIDQAIISKFERGERKPTKEQVEKFAEFYNLDKNQLVTSWLSDKLASYVLDEENGEEALKVAEEKVKYLKTIQHGK